MFSDAKLRNLLVAAGAVSLGGLLGCPIARPPVPPEYYDFRIMLQEAVADTTAGELRGDVEMQDRLDERLTDLAAIVRVDSLIVSWDSDAVLWPVAGAVTVALNRTLGTDGVGGSVRDAFQRPEGQRQAVDAIVIGLGRALRRVRTEGQAGEGDARQSAYPNSSSTANPRVANIR